MLFSNSVLAEIKDKIIQNLKDTDNFSFDFEQNINGKIENGNCKVKYQKKFIVIMIRVIKKFWFQMVNL